MDKVKEVLQHHKILDSDNSDLVTFMKILTGMIRRDDSNLMRITTVAMMRSRRRPVRKPVKI